MAGYGKALVEKTQVVEDRWCKNVIGYFEIFDALDGFRMYSASGPIRLAESTNLGSADESIGHGFILRLTGAQRHEVVGRPFSATSRGGQDYDDIADFFTTTHGLVQCHTITINISLTWVPTGKTVLLWHSTREVGFQGLVAGVNPFWQPFLPDGSLVLQSGDKDLAPPPVPLVDVRGREVVYMGASVAFYLKPVPNQVQVSEVAIGGG